MRVLDEPVNDYRRKLGYPSLHALWIAGSSGSLPTPSPAVLCLDVITTATFFIPEAYHSTRYLSITRFGYPLHSKE